MSRLCRRLYRFSFFLLVGFVLCSTLSVLPVGQTFVIAQSSPTQQLVGSGIEQYEAGKFNEAIALFLQALSQPLPDEERAVVHNNLALAYRQVGQLGEAAQQWEQVIQIYQRQDDELARRQLPKLLTEQAQAFNDLGQHRRAIKILQSVVELAKQYQDSRTQAAALGALGNAYWALGDYEQALAAHQESLQIAR
ncbi:MAG: tetratricopeptide repeat protein, partial [Microcoleus sp. SIO2G3]|nr:tetratricopeptide repeat protein [Microcoleus sp. SIO2G3]